MDAQLKHVQEKRLCQIAFTRQLEILSGETITAVNSVASVPADGLLIFGASSIIQFTDKGVVYPAAAVQFDVSGGGNETAYWIYANVTTSSGHKLTGKAKVYIGDGD